MAQILIEEKSGPTDEMNIQTSDIGDMLSNGDLEETINQAKKESMDMQSMLD